MFPEFTFDYSRDSVVSQSILSCYVTDILPISVHRPYGDDIFLCQFGFSLTDSVGVALLDISINHVVGVRAEPQMTEARAINTSDEVDAGFIVPYTGCRIASVQDVKTFRNRLSGCHHPCIPMSTMVDTVDGKVSIPPCVGTVTEPSPATVQLGCIDMEPEAFSRREPSTKVSTAEEQMTRLDGHAAPTAAERRGRIRLHLGPPSAVPRGGMVQTSPPLRDAQIIHLWPMMGES